MKRASLLTSLETFSFVVEKICPIFTDWSSEETEEDDFLIFFLNEIE